jgi:hypothetical protein
MRVRREIAEYCIKFSDFLYREGLFRGIFGYDFSVDLDTNEIYFMEMNPRITGLAALGFQVYQAQGHRFPFLLYHCLEFLGIDINLDVAALNEEWIGLDHYQEEVSWCLGTLAIRASGSKTCRKTRYSSSRTVEFRTGTSW